MASATDIIEQQINRSLTRPTSAAPAAPTKDQGAKPAKQVHPALPGVCSPAQVPSR